MIELEILLRDICMQLTHRHCEEEHIRRLTTGGITIS